PSRSGRGSGRLAHAAAPSPDFLSLGAKLVALPKWKFAALDVETTGLDCMAGHEIIEVAVVAFEPSGIEERWSSLVKPSRPIDPESIRVHGIRDADVAGAPSMAVVLPLVEEKTAGRV